MPSLTTPPSDFRPAGFVHWAKFVPNGPYFLRRELSESQAAGKRHEGRVLTHLRDLSASLDFRASPWIRFSSDTGNLPRYCQPDALILDHEAQHCSILEIKLSHCERAWWQLWKLYRPVLRAIFPSFSFSCVEIVRWTSEPVKMPGKIKLIDNPLTPLPSRTTGLHIFSTITRHKSSKSLIDRLKKASLGAACV